MLIPVETWSQWHNIWFLKVLTNLDLTEDSSTLPLWNKCGMSIISILNVGCRSYFQLTKESPQLAHQDEPWSVLWVFCWQLTHLPLVLHICVSEVGQHWFRYRLVAYSAPNHYLNNYWIITKWTPRNKLQWNFNQNTALFIENASENILCEMTVILSRGRWVTPYGDRDLGQHWLR